MTKRELRERLHDYIKIDLRINDDYFNGLNKVLVYAEISGIITHEMFVKIRDELAIERRYNEIPLETTLNNIRNILKIK